MDISIAPARPQDEEFLWMMIYYAAQMERDGAASPFAAQDHHYLKRYVSGWGAPNDVGVIGYEGSKPIGAVWSRLLTGDNRTYGYVDDDTPELAAAVLPEYIGKGVGTKLLRAYLNKAEVLFPAVALTVRVDNPAFRLYRRMGFVINKEITNRVGTKSYVMIIHFRRCHRVEIDSCFKL
jgi:ribosomal protein S18 acetylase RimI-like enzyme